MSVNPNPFYSLNSADQPTYAQRVAQPMPTGYDAESQLIRGTMSFSKDKLREIDPSYQGYTHVFVLRIAPFMTAIANGYQLAGYETNGIALAQQHCRNLKAILELGSTSYSGTPDLTLNTSEVNVGYSERSYPAPLQSLYDGKQFTIRALETRWEPLRRGIEYYINGVSDANVKTTMLNGALNADGTLMEPTLANMTFSLMIVQTDQSLNRIQDISLWNNVIITGVDRSNLDWENGTVEIVQPKDVAMQGVYMPDAQSDLVYNKARTLMGTRMKYYKRYRDMSEIDLGVSSWNTTGSLY